MTSYKIIHNNEDNEKILICPNCGDIFLHQVKTEIFNREEDEIEGLHIISDNHSNNVIISKNLEGNPSQRRDGLKVHFFCETCGRNSELTIWQHKGQTFINFI